MSLFPTWFAASRMLGWALVHFLWQGALLGLVYAGLRPLLPRGTPRYQLGMATLFAFILCPLLTVWKILLQPVSLASTDAGHAIAVATSVEFGAQGAGTALAGFDTVLPWLVLAWLLGVALLSGRAWCDWLGLKALVRMADPAPAWQRVATDLAQRFGLRRHVKIMCSRAVSTPVLIGWIRPVVVLPLAVATGFPATQVALILAHELAHLRRWDPLANLFQVAVETLLFYHPVVRWVSREVRNEREICCDRLALTVSGGSRREFVAVLAELGDKRLRRESLLLAASGGALLDRAQQMMLLPGEQVVGLRRSGPLLAALLSAALVILVLQLQWAQGRLQRGVDASVKQLQLLVTGMKTPLAIGSAVPLVLDPAPSSFGSIRLPRRSSKVPTAPSHRPGLRVVPRAPVAWQVHDLPPHRLAPISLTVAPAAAQPVLAETPPAPIRVRQPVYPQVALQRGIEGQVVVEFSLTSNGGVTDLRLVRAAPAGVFEQAALDAMRGWRYGLPGAAAASRRYRQTIDFTLDAKSGDAASRLIHARAGCQIVTGTHICRLPDEVGAPVRRLSAEG
ncbi:MAG: M56 family metallopeptidase [Pseudomonadota bacterium]|nr:M56 family metallopeptidase [Pseudomonadota bacterium]